MLSEQRVVRQKAYSDPSLSGDAAAMALSSSCTSRQAQQALANGALDPFRTEEVRAWGSRLMSPLGQQVLALSHLRLTARCFAITTRELRRLLSDADLHSCKVQSGDGAKD